MRRVLVLFFISALPFMVGFRSAAAPAPTIGVIYVTEQGDSLRRLARHFKVSPAAIALANDLSANEHLVADLGLLIPQRSDQVDWSDPIRSVSVSPTQPVQGQTVFVMVEATATITVSAQYEDIHVPFSHAGPRVWGLMPLDPLIPPGRHWLHLQVASAAGEQDIPVALDVQSMKYDVQNLDLSDDKTNLLDPALRAYENRRLSVTWNTVTPQKLWSGNFRLPLPVGDWIQTTAFGERRSYNGGPANTYHEGIDMWQATTFNTPILAPAAGVVALAEPLAVRGNAVILDHGRGLHTGYWHLSKILAKPGQIVKPGDVLGMMGTTGLSTGPHLHWEARVTFVPVNPIQWVDQSWLDNNLP